MENKLLVAGIIIAILALGYVVWGMFSQNTVQPNSTLPSNTQQMSGANLATSSSDCGDLKDQQNVTHMTHHPDQYKDCLAKVDPALLKQITG